MRAGRERRHGGRLGRWRALWRTMRGSMTTRGVWARGMLTQLARSWRMGGDCMTCAGTCANGVRIALGLLQLPELPGVRTEMGFTWMILDPDDSEAYGGQIHGWGWVDNPANHYTRVFSEPVG